MKTVEIEILGRKYFFKSDSPAQLQKRAEYLDKQLESLNDRFNTVDQNKLFVFYCLLLIEENSKLVEENKKSNTELQCINELLKKIEK